MADNEAIDGSNAESEKSDLKSSASTFQSRLPRPSRSVPDRDPSERPSRMTHDIPRTTTPLSDGYDDVRIGDLAPRSTAIHFNPAASLQDNNAAH